MHHLSALSAETWRCGGRMPKTILITYSLAQRLTQVGDSEHDGHVSQPGNWARVRNNNATVRRVPGKAGPGGMRAEGSKSDEPLPLEFCLPRHHLVHAVSLRFDADRSPGKPDWNQPALREKSDQFIFSLDRTGYFLSAAARPNRLRQTH